MQKYGMYWLVSVMLTSPIAATAGWIEVKNMAELRATVPATVADGDLAMLPGYYSAGDRGGGWFVWRTNSTATDDGGRFIIPNTLPSSGRWMRVLNGEVANVKMWGAKGDGVANDTGCIQSAISSGASGEVLFPYGIYIVTNTIVFPSWMHIMGEGKGNNTRVVMQSGKDVFRTYWANYVLQNGSVSGADWDHWINFERLYIDCGNSSTNAAIVVFRPGEACMIRDVQVVNGG